MDEEILPADLLNELRGTETDLARLVEQVLVRRLTSVAVSSEAVAAWEQRAPEAWAKVKRWLEARNVKILIVPVRRDT